MRRIFFVFLLFEFFSFSLTYESPANPDQLKAYREVYPEIKPGCIYCHVDKNPKKENGKHDLNAYGLKAKATFYAEAEKTLKDEIREAYARIFKDLGRHDEFQEEP
jgi:hypothetical protein